MKDFVKKVKQEDARIELRKKALAKTAERISAARIKLAASKAAATPPSSDKEVSSSPKPTLVPQDSNTPGGDALIRPSTPGLSRPVLSSSPLHPSLPPKPGSPAKLSSSQEPGRPITPVPVSAPAAPPPIVVIAPPASTPAPESIPSVTVDDHIVKFEEVSAEHFRPAGSRADPCTRQNKQRWSWLCLRTARDQYLQHFGKIGTGDIVLLAEEIEKEKKERERGQKGEETATTNALTSTMIGEDVSGSTAMSGEDGRKVESVATVSVPDGEGDIKMDDGGA